MRLLLGLIVKRVARFVVLSILMGKYIVIGVTIRTLVITKDQCKLYNKI